MTSKPYKSTPIFTEATLPAGLKKAHSTKAGIWGLLEILSGTVAYVIEANDVGPERQRTMRGGETQIIESELQHHVEPEGAIEMQIHFFDHRPEIDEAGMI